MSQQQELNLVDNDAAETAIKLLHREVYSVMKKTKATFNDGVIEKLIKDVGRYCSVPEYLRKNSDDGLNGRIDTKGVFFIYTRGQNE